MKIYITGCPGSGKSTLARKIAAATSYPCFHLDDIQYEPDPDNPGDNRKRTPAARDALFSAALNQPDWIMEDAGRNCFEAAQDDADFVAALCIPRPVLLFRVTRRWLRQRRGKERASYRPDFVMLRLMWTWTSTYRLDTHILHPEKTLYLKNQAEIDRFVAGILNPQ